MRIMWLIGILIGVLGYGIFMYEIAESPFEIKVVIDSEKNLDSEDAMECLINHLTRPKLRSIFHERAFSYEILQGTPQHGMEMVNRFQSIEVYIKSEVDMENSKVRYYSQTPINSIDVEYRVNQIGENKIEIVKYVQQYQPVFFTLVNYSVMRKRHRDFLEQLEGLLSKDPKFCYLEDEIDKINESQLFNQQKQNSMESIEQYRMEKIIQQQLSQFEEEEQFLLLESKFANNSTMDDLNNNNNETNIDDSDVIIIGKIGD